MTHTLELLSKKTIKELTLRKWKESPTIIRETKLPMSYDDLLGASDELLGDE